MVTTTDARTTGPIRSSRTLPPQLGAASTALRHQEFQTHGRLRLGVAKEDRTRRHRTRPYAGLSARKSQSGSRRSHGLGKTMMAQNICHAAVLAGSSVLFRSAPALLEELHRQNPEGRRKL